jgi:hypothetical protein
MREIPGSFLPGAVLAGFALLAISLLIIEVVRSFAPDVDPMFLAVMIAGSIVFMFLVARPTLLLWFTTASCLVLVGIVVYFVPGFQKSWWAAYGAGALLYVPAAIEYLRGNTPRRRFRPMLLHFSLYVFFVLVVATYLATRPPPAQIIVEAKTLFMFGGVWAFLGCVAVREKIMRNWLLLLMGIALLQWPMALYQYFVVRGRRVISTPGEVTASDSVVGTFGGNPEGGGLTGAMVFFLVCALIFLLALRRERVISRRTLFALAPLVMIPVLFAEVKAVFVYLPLGLFVLYRRALLRNPLALVASIAGGALVLGGCLYAYNALHWSVRGKDFETNVIESFAYTFETEQGYYAEQTGEMPRWGTLVYWYQQHAGGDPMEMLFGHGFGASRTQGQVLGTAAADVWPLKIDRLGLTKFLWDVGVLGVGALLGILAGAFRLAGRIARAPDSVPWKRAVARGLQAAIPLFFMSFLYRNDLPYAAPSMFLLMAALGLLAWLNQKPRSAVQAS